MEHDGGPVLGEDLPHPLLFLAIGEHRHRRSDVPLLLELTHDLKQVVLRMIDQHQPSRTDPRDLAGQFAAD